MKKSSLILEEATLSYNKCIAFPIKPKGFRVSSIELPSVPVGQSEQANSESLERGKSEAAIFYQKEIDKLRNEYAVRQEKLLITIQQKVDQVFAELDNRLPSLVVNMAEKVLGGIELDADMIRSLVKSMIEEFGTEGENLDVFLSPDDLNLLKSLSNKDKAPDSNDNEEGFASAIAGIFDGIDGDDALLEGYPNVKFFEDPSLQHGDCQVKSRFGLLDGRISTKLRRLEEEIKGD
tara:strand:- start:1300 stop:2004 length:705 start_codon:yes stop_codon:yes gene_type:complete